MLHREESGACDAPRQVLTLDEFHDERREASALLKSVDRSDVRMIQRGEDLGFALKTRQPIVVSCERWRQDLDRDLTLQLGVGRPIHLAHAPFADLGGDLVGAEASAGGEGQRWGLYRRAGAKMGRM